MSEISIKETTVNDLEKIQTLWNHPQVMYYVGFPQGLGYTMQQMHQWYEQLQKQTNQKHYSIYHNYQYCGETFYRLKDHYAEMDIKLLPEAQGKGIASYALSYAIAEAFLNPSIKYVKVDPNPANQKAIHLYQRLGFKRNENTDQDWNLTLKDFKPNHNYVKQAVTVSDILEKDYPRLWEISAKEEWYPFTDLNAPYFDEHDAVSYQQFVAEIKKPLKFGIYFAGRLVGKASYYWESQATKWLEMGMIIYDDQYWRKGIGSQVLTIMTDYLFKQYPDIQRVGFVTWSGNTGMMRTGAKCGFKQEADLRQTRYYQGVYYYSVRFGLTRQEYQQFRQCQQTIETIKDSQEKYQLVKQLLQANPHHFGIPDAIEEYSHKAKKQVVFSDKERKCVLSLIVHSPKVIEIDAMAVHPQYHQQGFGRCLINQCIIYGRALGASILLVKTLAASHPDSYYAKTRKFYEALGFMPGQQYPTLWGTANPCQEYFLVL